VQAGRGQKLERKHEEGHDRLADML